MRVDGCKRIAASIFLEFLGRNDALFRNEEKVISDGALVAITLMIAEKIIRQYAFLILREQSLNYFLWNNQQKILMKIIHQKGMDFQELH